MNSKLVADMEAKIFDAIESVVQNMPHPPIEETFEALLRMVAFTMIHVCPECRKSLAKSLEDSIPRVLAHANSFEQSTDDRPRYFCGHAPAQH